MPNDSPAFQWVVRFLLTFLFLGVLWDIGIDPWVSIVILSFLIHPPLLAPGGKPPRPRWFLIRTTLELFGLCCARLIWEGAIYRIGHGSLNLQNVWYSAIGRLPDATIVFDYVCWWFFTAWWAAYVPVRSATRQEETPSTGGGLDSGRYKEPAILTLGIYSKKIQPF